MIYLRNIKTDLYLVGILSECGPAIFSENIEDAREFISYQEAGDTARTIEVPVEVFEE